MVRIAGERIADLFALAEREAVASHGDLAHRYVVIARKVGMRYNVRLLREYRELYCRTCSVFWVEGRTVRTRLRSGRRVRTCLACGRERRTPVRPLRDRSARALAAVRHATGARRIQAGVPMVAGLAVSLIAPLLPLVLKFSPMRKFMVAASGHSAGSHVSGSHTSRVWVEGGKGNQQASALLEAGEGYALAAEIGVRAIEALLAKRPAPGAYTPATAFGADFIARVDGVRITHS